MDVNSFPCLLWLRRPAASSKSYCFVAALKPHTTLSGYVLAHWTLIGCLLRAERRCVCAVTSLWIHTQRRDGEMRGSWYYIVFVSPFWLIFLQIILSTCNDLQWLVMSTCVHFVSILKMCFLNFWNFDLRGQDIYGGGVLGGQGDCCPLLSLHRADLALVLIFL